jgi:hypothetical protein
VSEGDKLQFLAGDVNGLRTVLMALVDTHPDLRALLQQLDRLAELQVAVTNLMPVTEKFIEGQSQAIDAFRARILEIIGRGQR